MNRAARSVGSLGVGAVVAGALVFFMHWAAPVLAPIFLALFLTALATPLYDWLVSKRLPQPVCLLVIVAIVLLSAAALAVLGYISLVRLRDGLEHYEEGLATRLPRLQEHLATAGVPNELRAQLTSERLSAVLGSTVTILAGAVATLSFSVVLTALLLLESRRFAEVMNQELGRRPVFAQAPEVARAAITYFGVRIRINLFTALTATTVLLILGVDYAPLWGVGVFFLSFIPYIGLVVALIPPTVLAFAEYGIGRALVVVITAVVVNLVAENILEPAMTGRALSLSPAAVFVSFFVWVWVLGPLGALLSMPITIMLLLLFNSSDETRWLARIIGSAAAPTAGAAEPSPPLNDTLATKVRR